MIKIALTTVLLTFLMSVFATGLQSVVAPNSFGNQEVTFLVGFLIGFTVYITYMKPAFERLKRDKENVENE